MKGGGGERKLGRNKGRHSETNKNVLFLWGQQFFPRFKIKKGKQKKNRMVYQKKTNIKKEKAKRKNQY